MAMVTFFLISILAIAAPCAYAVQHIVGDSNGWTNFGDYTTWAASNTFNVGDTLLFSYSSSHGVDVVSKSDYDNCATSNAIQSYTGGSTTVQLTQPGPMYFACPSFGHCSSGMKLAINVESASSTTPSTTPSSTGTPSSDGNNLTPPSSSSPSTPTPSKSNGQANGANTMSIGFLLIMAPLFAIMC